jgi:hypothetical protein
MKMTQGLSLLASTGSPPVLKRLAMGVSLSRYLLPSGRRKPIHGGSAVASLLQTPSGRSTMNSQCWVSSANNWKLYS